MDKAIVAGEDSKLAEFSRRYTLPIQAKARNDRSLRALPEYSVGQIYLRIKVTSPLYSTVSPSLNSTSA